MPADSSARSLPGEEVIVPPPHGLVSPVTRVRGTLVVASLKAIEQRGYGVRYFAALPKEHHVPVREVLANSWVPEALAHAHYVACDALGLAATEIMKIGAEVGDNIRATFLGTLAGVAREAGTTPWIYLERLPRLFPRVVVGGAVAVYKLGPKDARAEWYGVPGLAIPYFRTSFRGANQGIMGLFCTKAYVSETRALAGGDWAFRASWA